MIGSVTLNPGMISVGEGEEVVRVCAILATRSGDAIDRAFAITLATSDGTGVIYSQVACVYC